jgi:hypothetical protein
MSRLTVSRSRGEKDHISVRSIKLSCSAAPSHSALARWNQHMLGSTVEPDRPVRPSDPRTTTASSANGDANNATSSEVHAFIFFFAEENKSE